MSITFLSHTAMGGDFVVGSHHLATALASRGHEVRHVSAPVTPVHLLNLGDRFVRARMRRWWRGGEQLGGVHDVVPASPLPWALARLHPALMRAHSRCMLARPGRGIGSLRVGESRHLIVDEPRFLGLALAARRDATLTYRATDLYAAMRGDPRIADAERELCRHAAVVIATSENIAAHLRALSGRPVHVIANGVDFAHFSTAQGTSDLPSMRQGERANRAVYVGAFDTRFCSQSLRAAALAHPARTFLLAGPGGERVVSGLGLANVHALGSVSYRQLPALLHSCAVGLLPFSASAANAGRSPMKLFEYAAAGLAVAATCAFQPGRVSLPTLSLADSEAEFATAVGVAFERSADAARVTAAREIARAQDWNAKAAELLQLVQRGRAEAPLGDVPATDEPNLPVASPWS
jgi:teichuronic acid biosynthesis glycosyltransferase TuaH